MPKGYFDEDTVDALSAMQQRALSDRREELLADFPTALIAGKLRNTWRPAAVGVYRNWLLYLCAKKNQRLKARQGPREYKRVGAVTAAVGARAHQAPEAGRQITREAHGDL